MTIIKIIYINIYILINIVLIKYNIFIYYYILLHKKIQDFTDVLFGGDTYGN